MKLRYFLLPIIIISIMVYIIDNENIVSNKKNISDNLDINYPFFNNKYLDSYINSYLNNYINYDNNVIIDYDYYDNDSLYYLTFYKYIFSNNVVINDSDSFVIDVDNDSISKDKNVSYEYDFINNKGYDTNKKLVALTFDDGPNYNTNKIIDILNKYNAKATFFVLGSRIKNNENILIKMKDSGMEIGNHTYNHLLLTKYSTSKIKSEIDSTSNLVYDITGSRPNLLRPSYGSVNKKIKSVVDTPIIIWNIDTLDWKYHNSKKIASRIINNVEDGDIILMHDIYSSTLNAVDNIIPILKDMGYEFVTVSQLFYYKGISLEKSKVYGAAR